MFSARCCSAAERVDSEPDIVAGRSLRVRYLTLGSTDVQLDKSPDQTDCCPAPAPPAPAPTPTPTRAPGSNSRLPLRLRLQLRLRLRLRLQLRLRLRLRYPDRCKFHVSPTCEEKSLRPFLTALEPSAGRRSSWETRLGVSQGFCESLRALRGGGVSPKRAQRQKKNSTAAAAGRGG